MYKKIILILLLSVLVSAGYGKVVIGDFETGISPWTAGPDGGTLALSATGVTEGYQSLSVTAVDAGFNWAVQRDGILDLAAYPILKLDITWVAAEWVTIGGNWVQLSEIAISSNSPSGWMQFGAPYCTDPVNPTYPGSWDPVSWGAVHTRTLTWDISGYDPTGATWMQLLISTNMSGDYNPANGGQFGNFYIDNVYLIPEPATVALLGLGGLALIGGRRS